MISFTLQHRTFIVAKWHELKSAIAVRRAFRCKFSDFHGKNLPSLMFIKRVVNKFTHFGTVSDLRRRYIPTRKQHITDQQISAVKKRLLEASEIINPKSSSRAKHVLLYYSKNAQEIS